MNIIIKGFCQSVLKKSYAQHLYKVMQTLIHSQHCALKEICSTIELGSVQHHINFHTNVSADIIADINAHIQQQVSLDTKVHRDFLISYKTRGFLNHQQADYLEFI